MRDQPLRRSRSAPNLTEWPVLCKTPAKVPAARRTSDDEDEETVRRRFEKHRMKRRRALSQNKMRSLLRRTKATSEIDLAHIDKDATFGADIASYEILSRVVDALETAVPNQPGDHQHQPSQHVHHHLHQEAGNLVSKSDLASLLRVDVQFVGWHCCMGEREGNLLSSLPKTLPIDTMKGIFCLLDRRGHF